MLRALVLLLAVGAAVAFATPRGQATAACQPLPPRLLGVYHRADDHNWALRFAADCTYQAKQRGVEEGAGDYTVTTGAGSTSGVLVFSNDRGCRQPPSEDLPTRYTFGLVSGVLLLAPQSGSGPDLCADAHGEGRARELSGHGGWIKLISGTIRITTKGARVGRFTARGAVADRGTFVQTSRRKSRSVEIRSLRFGGAYGGFTLTERIPRKGKLKWKLGAGSGGYAGLSGSGVGVRKRASASFRGNVTN